MTGLTTPRDLLKAVNKAYPEWDHFIQLDDVVFDKPELYLHNLCNSRIKIKAKDTSVHFKNEGVVFYNRLRLDYYLKDIRIPGNKGDYANTHQVVDALVEAYGFDFSSDEFTFAQVDVNESTVSLKSLDSSIAFFTNFPATLSYMGF